MIPCRVVDQTIEAAEGCCHFGIEALNLGNLAKIGLKNFSPALLGGFTGFGFGVVVMNRDAGAFPGQAQGNGAADALGGASHQDDLAVELRGAGCSAGGHGGGKDAGKRSGLGIKGNRAGLRWAGGACIQEVRARQGTRKLVRLPAMDIHPLVVLTLAIAVVFILIIRLKINAFLALITAAMTVGLLSSTVSLAEVMPEVAESFGRVCGGIGIVIALAALIGQCLMESGAADKITRVFVRALGEKRASLSMLASGYVLSVPVFFDTVFYLLIPLARALRVRTGKNYVLFVMAICAGGAVTHTLVPPTPGPLAMAATLNIDLGMMILVGGVVGIGMSIVGWLFARNRDQALNIPLRETPGLSLQDLEELATRDESRLPSFFLSMLPIVLPVLFITSNTAANAIDKTSAIAGVTAFLGNPNFALLVSAAISLYLLASQKGYSLAEMAKPVETAFASGGLIILITAAGGSFGGMLVRAEVGTTLGNLAQDFGIPLLLLSFLLGTLLKVAQGSGTVTMITVSSIMAPLIVSSPPPFHAVYVACAIGSGSLVGSWMNDSGFWVYKQMSGFTEMEALQTWTPLLAVMGISGYVITQILAILFPLV